MIEWPLGLTTWSPAQEQDKKAVDSKADVRMLGSSDKILTSGMSAVFPVTNAPTCLQQLNLIICLDKSTSPDVQIAIRHATCQGELSWCASLWTRLLRRRLSSYALRMSLPRGVRTSSDSHTMDPRAFHFTSLSHPFSGGSHGRCDCPQIRLPRPELFKLLATGTTPPTSSDQEGQEYIFIACFVNKNTFYTQL